MCLALLLAAPALQPSVWYDAGSTRRRAVVAGNWKLNPSSISEAKSLLKLLAANRRAQESAGQGQLPEVAIFPPHPFLATAIDLVAGTSIAVGAQNIGERAGPGAFTGEVAASQVASLGCSMVLLGHSERRALFDEDDALIAAKVRLALDAGLRVVLCVGETQQEFEAELLGAVTEVQLKKGLCEVTAAEAASGAIIIAYEPVWAIGTGLVATPEQAQEAHALIRRTLSELFTPEISRGVVVQYGGSVTPESVDELMRMPDVDGALVGGASLKADSFGRICDFTPPDAPREAPRRIAAREVVAAANVLGESPVWSAREGRLYWVDAPSREVWSWDETAAPTKWSFDSTVGCVALRLGGGLVVALEDRIVGFDTGTRTSEVLAPAPEGEGGALTRYNDGRVDREGRLLIGMYNNYHRAGATGGDDNAGLYQISKDRGVAESGLDYRFRVSNCICFSPDGRTLYFADTPTRKIFAFAYDSAVGLDPGSRRLVYTQPAGLAGGPDGAQTDADGYLWAALSGAGQVVRIDPRTGATVLAVDLPVASPTSCTFGGKALDTLYITTRGPDGGGLFAVQLPFGIRGLAEPECEL